MHSRPTFDLAVVGAGPAGLATAIAAAEKGLSVTVLDALPWNEERSVVDGIFKAGEHLAPDAKPLLRALGLPIVEHSFPSSGVASSWSDEDLAYKDYLFHPFGLGLNVERPAFDRALVDIALETGVVLKERTRVREPLWEGESWAVSCDHHDLSARFLVDATGREGALMPSLTEFAPFEDRLIGLSAPVHIVGAGGGRLLLEAMPLGWWYLAPLSAETGVATFVTDGDLLKGRGLTLDAFWQATLEASRYVRARVVSVTAAVRAFSARSRVATRIHGERWLKVGDAAAAFDPLSSMGMERGLRQGLEGACAVVSALDGDPSGLQRFEAKTREEYRLYRELRSQFYGEAKRFAQFPFWRRREAMALEHPIRRGCPLNES